MCQVMSFIIHPATQRIRVHDVSGHAETYAHFRLKDTNRPNCYREGHYLPDGTVEVRTIDTDKHTGKELADYIKSKWPTFVKFWNAHAPRKISGDLNLHSLQGAEHLRLPESIGGDLYLHSLQGAEHLRLPESVGGGLDLGSLQSAEHLKLPESIGGWLYLGSLKSAKGLKLPESIGGNLYLDSLKSAEHLNLPKSIGGGLYLGSLSESERQKIRDKGFAVY